MLNAFERLPESGDRCGLVNAESDRARVAIIGCPREGVSRLNDLCAVEDFGINLVGEVLLDAESQFDDIVVGLRIVAWLVANVVFAGIVKNKVELGVPNRERLVQSFEEGGLPGLVFSNKDGHIIGNFN